MFEKISRITANWAQVITLGVVIFGYFYTVKPVFQKEKLSEDLARLQIDQDSWEVRLDEIKNQLSKLETEKTTLESELQEIAYEKERMSTELVKLTTLNLQAQKAFQTSDSALKEAEKLLYEQERLKILGETPISLEGLFLINNSTNVYEIFKKESLESIADRLSASFIQPSDFVEEKLKKLRDDANSISSQIYRNAVLKIVDEYEAGLEKNGTVLQCPEPNYQSWQSAFNQALSLGSQMVLVCAKHHSDKRIDEEGWTEKEFSSIKESEFWEKQMRLYSRSCSVSIDHVVSTTYVEHWMYVNEPCKQRLLKISSIALKPGSIFELTSFRDMSPPHDQYIKSKIQTMINDWR